VKPPNAGLALRNLRRFLLARGWQLSREGKRTDEYTAPIELELPAGFTLATPRSAEAPDVGRVLTGIATTLGELYSYSSDQLNPVIEEADSVLSIRIASETTGDGSIEFGSFSGILDELRGMIVHTAAFVAEEDPMVDFVPAEAQAYLDSCRFLQTARGSFVASVQMPTEAIIRDASLLNPEPKTAQAVIERMASVLDYVSSSVLAGQPEIFSAEHLQQHLDVINLSVLEDVRGLLQAVGIASLSFSFLGIDSTNEVSAGRLSAEKMAWFGQYLRFVRNQLTKDVPIELEGKVVELRSRNPQGNRNYVLVQGQFENHPTFVAVTLNNASYGVAVQAHRANRIVRVVGRARKMKTQIKVTALEAFTQL
jgi:hypothetical protein